MTTNQYVTLMFCTSSDELSEDIGSSKQTVNDYITILSA